MESGKVIKIMESVVMWANGFLAAVTVSEQPAEPQVCGGGRGLLELFLQVTPGDFTAAPLQSLSSTKHPGWRGQWQPRVQPWCSALFGCDPIAGGFQVAEGPSQGSAETGGLKGPVDTQL